MLRKIKESHHISIFFIEIFSIILGILLAFVVNEWRDSRKHLQDVQLSLENIYREVVSNRLIVDSTLHYHQSCKISLSGSSGDFLNIWRGINPPALSSSAYKTAQSMRVFGYMEYPIVNSIESVYQKQKFLYELSSMYTQSLIQNGHLLNTHLRLPEYQVLTPVFNDLAILEKELKKSYENLLMIIETRYPGVALAAIQKNPR